MVITPIKSLIKWIVYSLMLIICIGTGYLAYTHFEKTPEERFFYKKLSLYLSDNNKEVPLKGLTNFSWEYAYYIGPYTYLKHNKGIQINKIYYEVPESLQINLDSDGMWALCFITKNKVTHTIRGRKIKNHAQNLKQRLYGPNDIMVIDDQDQFYLKEIE